MSSESTPFIELTTSTTSRKYSDEERQSHCDDWKNSGLSMSDYCRQSGLAVSTLSKWLSDEPNRKFTIKNSEEKWSIANNQTSPGIEIILVSGIRMRFTKMPISEILRFVKAFES